MKAVDIQAIAGPAPTARAAASASARKPARGGFSASDRTAFQAVVREIVGELSSRTPLQVLAAGRRAVAPGNGPSLASPGARRAGGHATVIAVFADHARAAAAVTKLAAGGTAMQRLSIVGKGCHTDETAVGFYNSGDRVQFWGGRDAFWGGLSGLFFGGVFLTTPLVGPVIVLGFIAAAVIAALDGVEAVPGLSALGAALASIGVPTDGIVEYETAIAADRVLLMAHGPADEVTQARSILRTAGAERQDGLGAAQASDIVRRFLVVA